MSRLYALARKPLFALDAERAHEWTLRALALGGAPLAALARACFTPPNPALARDVAGVRWAGPIGLAAGLDKDGVAIPFWAALGFGSVEVGTVTAHPQPGNPRPRLFRLPAERALINRMGFNNHGSEALAARLRRLHDRGRWPGIPVGANLGKSKVTPLEDAPADYALSTTRLRGLVDWFTVNVSSPNTPGLRDLQDPSALAGVIDAVLAAAGDTPVLLKLAPDLAPEGLAQAVDLACARGVAGILATNTTIDRSALVADPNEPGGLSGRPLWPLARARIEVALQAASGRVPVVGIGGIEHASQVRELLDLGCAAVQLYTALIYEGPGLPSRLHRELADA